MKYDQKAVCSECQGAKTLISEATGETIRCYWCDGTGYAVDEDTQELFYKGYDL